MYCTIHRNSYIGYSKVFGELQKTRIAYWNIFNSKIELVEKESWHSDSQHNISLFFTLIDFLYRIKVYSMVRKENGMTLTLNLKMNGMKPFI